MCFFVFNECGLFCPFWQFCRLSFLKKGVTVKSVCYNKSWWLLICHRLLICFLCSLDSLQWATPVWIFTLIKYCLSTTQTNFLWMKQGKARKPRMTISTAAPYASKCSCKESCRFLCDKHFPHLVISVVRNWKSFA